MQLVTSESFDVRIWVEINDDGPIQLNLNLNLGGGEFNFFKVKFFTEENQKLEPLPDPPEFGMGNDRSLVCYLVPHLYKPLLCPTHFQ